MTAPSHLLRLVGRRDLLARLRSAVTGALEGGRSAVLISGQAGIGKTALMEAMTQLLDAEGAVIGWGTCVESAPGYWPWTRALQGVISSVGVEPALALAGQDAALLASITPVFGEVSGQASSRDLLLLMDAVERWLGHLAAQHPVIVVLDDLQWADDSTLALLDFLARTPQLGGLCILGAYRDHELTPQTRQRFASLLSCAQHLDVPGLDREAVAELLADVASAPLSQETIDLVFRRGSGHPLFTRELGLFAARGDAGYEIPVAIREAITRRTALLPEATRRVLVAAAIAGAEPFPDVLAGALGITPMQVAAATVPAERAGLLVRADEGRLRFAHDLYREALATTLDHADRMPLHQALGSALEARVARGGEVGPAELAQQFTASVALDGPERAARWALQASATDCRSLAFVEGAGHLRRWRSAVADAGLTVDDELLVEVLLAEADALSRSGSVIDARGLLLVAADAAQRCPDPRAIARTALASTQLGARFATRRDAMVSELELALGAVAGVDLALQARVTAALARELSHSVAEDRPRAAPLSEQALELGRRGGDPEVLLACLLARHDVLWTPGEARTREGIAREIVSETQRSGRDESRAEGLLLLANALLEQGSAAYAAALDSCLEILDRLDQPRHTYTAATRRAAVALLRGDLDDAADRVAAAAALGESIREPDAGNVLMSQRLELVRARGTAEELEKFAVDAIAHWTGAPVHAHAIAAGFLARAGKLVPARAHVATVLDLGTWRTDRSYLWSVFVRELSVAAIALETPTCASNSWPTCNPCPRHAASMVPSSPSPAATPTAPGCSPRASADPKAQVCSNRRDGPTNAWVLPAG